MTNCNTYNNSGNCCCLHIELSIIDQQSCVNPFDYLAERYADSETPFEDLSGDLQDGIVVDDSENLCCPTCGNFYSLSNVQSAIDLVDGLGLISPGEIYECPGNVYSSVESFLKWAEATGWAQSPEPGIGVGNILPIDNNFTEIIMNFLEVVLAPTDPSIAFGDQEVFSLLDAGIVEIGSLKNNNCSSMNNFFNMVLQFKDQYTTPINIIEKINDFLDNGIVIDCPFIANTQAYLKNAEARKFPREKGELFKRREKGELFRRREI